MNLLEPGRVALITGGSRGIGFAAAAILAKEGARVAIVDINGDQAVSSSKRIASECGVDAIGLQADISQEDDVRRVVAEVLQKFGRIDILINSAAVVDDLLFLESTPANWRRMLDICLYGPMLLVHTVLPHMVERKYGRIICLASDSARIGQARLSYYAAAKAGVIALLKSVAQEVGANGITANVVSPGATQTELRQAREESLRSQMGEEKYAKRQQTVLRMYPTRRIGEPDDIGNMIAFLASDRASWITGQVISVNGGFTMP
jgi:NAD(P)-dependent dehydrogenase (short-subunit alcohol dehydrogenase family)